MDYFCYISQGKVDQLYDSFTTAAPESWTEVEDHSKSKGASVGTDLLPWINTRITYGRNDTLRRSVKLKETYVHKLRQVLLRVRPHLVPFEWRSVLTSPGVTFYHHRASFRARVIEKSAMAELRTADRERELLLHCSMKYFSDHPGDDSIHITSSNHAFFEGDMPLELDTVFFVLHEEGARFLGSPLFLKLAPRPGLLL